MFEGFLRRENMYNLLGSWLPYFVRDTLPRAISIIAGFRLKNRSKFSAIVYVLMYMLESYFVYKIFGFFSSTSSDNLGF